jgi:hypothetical protein
MVKIFNHTVQGAQNLFVEMIFEQIHGGNIYEIAQCFDNVADHLPGRPKAFLGKWIRWFGILP